MTTRASSRYQLLPTQTSNFSSPRQRQTQTKKTMTSDPPNLISSSRSFTAPWTQSLYLWKFFLLVNFPNLTQNLDNSKFDICFACDAGKNFGRGKHARSAANIRKDDSSAIVPKDPSEKRSSIIGGPAGFGAMDNAKLLKEIGEMDIFAKFRKDFGGSGEYLGDELMAGKRTFGPRSKIQANISMAT